LGAASIELLKHHMKVDKALHKLSNGYYILTAVKPGDELKTRDKDYIAAGIINWVSQISFDPVQVGISVKIDSHLNETIDYSDSFTLHVLSDKQKDWVDAFSTKSEITGDKINGMPYSLKDDHIEFEDTLATIACKLSNSVRCGDHTLHIGEVKEAKGLKSGTPLTTQERASKYQGEHAEAK